MKHLLVWAALGAVSLMPFTSSISHGDETSFRSGNVREEISLEQAWKRFLKTCGLAISDPSGYLATLPEKGLLGEKVRTEIGDGNYIQADLMNGRIWESVVIARFDTRVDIDCYFHFKPSQATDGKEIAKHFQAIMKANPDLEFVGGYGEVDYPHFTTGQGVSKSKSYHYSVLNVWGQKDASVEVTFSEHQVYLGVSAINRD